MVKHCVTETSVIDWKRLAELRDEVGVDDFNEIIALFLEEVDGVIDLFRGGQGFEELDTYLHFLKGSARHIGFCEFEALCQLGEILLSQSRQDQIDITELISGYEETRQAFLAQTSQIFVI